MIKTVFALLAGGIALSAWADPVWTVTDGAGNVVGFARNAAPDPAPLGCCTIMDETDARMVAFLNAAPTPQQQYDAAIAAGVQIVSTSAPSLNGTYSIVDSAITKITAQQVYIATKGTFTNGQSSRQWLDKNNGVHMFSTTAAFTVWAEAVAQYVDSLVSAQTALEHGQTVSWPSSVVTIP